MSTSGQGDQKVEIGKDESEITSTTSDNGGAPVSVTEIKNIETVAADADSTVPLESKETSEAVNDEVETDSAIDSFATTDSNNDKVNKSEIKSDVAHGKTTPPSKDNEAPLECSNIEPEPCSSKTSDKDSGSFTEELELKWDEDDVDDAIPTDDIKDKDIENNESNKSTDKTEQFIQKLDLVINESKNDVDVCMDLLENKSTMDETTQLIQKLDLVIDESKNDVDLNKDLLKNESNQSSHQIIEGKSSDVDYIIQKDETRSSKGNSEQDNITSSIDEGNKIDDVEMTSTSFESQNIIDEIDNITKEANINKDLGASSHEELNNPVDTKTPNLEVDMDTISADELSKNVDFAEVKPQLTKEEKMEVEIISESPLQSIEDAVSNEKDNEDKCEAAQNETAVLEEKNTKEVPLVDITDKNVTKEIIETGTKDVEIKDLELNESTNQKEDKKEIDEPNVSISTEVSSIIDPKTEDRKKDTESINAVLEEKNTKEVPLVDTTDKNVTKEIIETGTEDVEIKDLELNESTNQKEDKKEIDVPNVCISTEVSSIIDPKTEDRKKDTESINKPLEANNTETNKNDSEQNDSKSIPIDETECDTKSNVIEDSNADDSILGPITPNIHHRINKPNVMLDIPTQELSDIEAELDDDDLDYDADNAAKTLDDKKPETLPKTTADSEMNELSDETSKNVIDKVSITSPTIEIDGTSSVNINTDFVSTNMEELRTEELSTPKSEVTSTRLKSNIDIEESKEVIDENVTSTQEINENLVKEIDSENSTVTEVKVTDSNSNKSVEDKTKMQIDDEQPSTSKSDAGLEIPPDTDDDQEVSDSLGLLAESSRVVDDNDDDDGDDAEDQEVDDNDDEDFDPYEETNSEMAEDMDDSNTPPPELDPKLIKPGDKLRRESDEDAQESTMDIVDDIECDENDLDLELPDDTASEIQINKDQPEIIDADMHKEKAKVCPPDKIITILEKVLGSQITTGYKAQDTSVKGNVRNYVEVECSSDSDDVQEVSKTPGLDTASSKEVTGSGSSLAVPKTQNKMPKINTDEVSIKTASGSSAPVLHIPETTIDPKPSTKRDEIFNVDSDDEEAVKEDDKKTTPKEKVTEENKAPKQESPKTEKKCINPSCTSETRNYYVADRSTAAYYSLTRRSALVCEPCRRRASERSEALVNGIKDLRPLLELDMNAPSQQLVEISDSDSDGEGGDETDRIGEEGAGFLEEHLADVINETWRKYEMESRLKSTETHLLNELEQLEADVKEIDAMLDECQKKTDAIRFDFYKDYETRRKNVGAIVIHDTPFSSYSHIEKDVEQLATAPPGSRYPKRRAASIANDTPAKKPAIPLGYTPLDANKVMDPAESKADDDKEDISVVKLSAESAPPDLPPPGEIVRPPLRVGMTIYAMRNAFGTWLKGKIMDVQPKAAGQQYSQCRVKFEHKVKNPCKVLAGRCLAYSEPSAVRMTIGTRVVALFKDPQNPARRESFYSGVIAEIPNPVNSYRYLVFFDDGYAQYVHHQHTRVVCESSALVWEEVHQFIREFIYKYLLSYPERPMVRLHAGEKLKTEWNGKWWDSKVLKVDASIALINFDEDNRTEWIYRGSTRLAPLYLELQAARAGEGKGRSRLPRNKALIRTNMPCVEYTRSDEQAASRAAETQQNEEMRRQRAVAKKSTTQSTPPTLAPTTNYEGVISRVVYYTPKNAVKPYKMSAHNCTVHCRRSDLLSMKDLRTYNPLAKPLLSGWERQTVRYKGHREVVYRAPCGRRLRNMSELHRYLRILQSDMSVDLFDFTPGTHCLAEFVLSKCNVSKKDLSHGKENVPVPCVNYYDNSLPEFCSYNTERTPTAGVPLNLDPEFLCGCDCTDDCMDKTKCACWKMTLEGARTIGLEGPNIGYAYRRLPEPLPSGIYECNSRCKCKQTCLNRVAQHPLQLKLQVFKTINRGWGIRALNDVPKGSFLCVYAGNLLTDATANLDGLNEGDEYLAELDYIEVVEAMKEGYEDDIPDKDKALDKKGSSASESAPSSESEEEQDHTKKDGDFQPGYIGHTNLEFKKSLRKREKKKKKEEEKQKEEANRERKDDCITISDDEEVREPSRFTAEDGMVDKGLITKQSSRVSVRTLFGKDEACYIMDAKVQGNIGRYLNHSCHPNVFVQNVFVDTHDPRFPWVAFFALSHVRAGTELTWNYNYDVGSVPEKVLYCYCGASNCRGRLL